MSDVWHKLPEQPENGRDVLEKWQDRGIIHYTHFISKNGIAEDNPFTIAWCYLDDLLACEQELDRTRKALDVAVDAIKNTTEYLGNQEPLVDVMAMNLHTDLSKALEQITALEQKDK